MKKKKGSRYTPPKPKPDWYKPWWLRRVYLKSGDKTEYFQRVIDFLELVPVDESLVLPVKNNRTTVHV